MCYKSVFWWKNKTEIINLKSHPNYKSKKNVVYYFKEAWFIDLLTILIQVLISNLMQLLVKLLCYLQLKKYLNSTGYDNFFSGKI